VPVYFSLSTKHFKDQGDHEQYLQAALRQIDDLANEDVEMAVNSDQLS